MLEVKLSLLCNLVLGLPILMVTAGGHWYILIQNTISGLLLQREQILDLVWRRTLLSRLYYLFFLGIPLIGLLIWFIVSHGLKPLRSLSDQLKNKQVNDLTPIKLPALQKELKHVVHSINTLIARLGSALEREQRFTADAAHELRTPISALKIQLHNLKDELSNDSEAFFTTAIWG